MVVEFGRMLAVHLGDLRHVRHCSLGLVTPPAVPAKPNLRSSSVIRVRTLVRSSINVPSDALIQILLFLIGRGLCAYLFAKEGGTTALATGLR